jgi:hypothetical protein
MTTTINASTSSGLVTTPDNSGTIDLQSNGTTKATISSAGFAAPGCIVQVVNTAYTTQQSTTSSTYANTNLTLNITPKFATSKILIFVTHSGILPTGAANAIANFRLYRDSTNILQFGAVGNSSANGEYLFGAATATYLDSPATTSTVTYKTQWANKYNSGTVYYNAYDCASTLTLMEVAQ